MKEIPRSPSNRRGYRNNVPQQPEDILFRGQQLDRPRTGGAVKRKPKKRKRPSVLKVIFMTVFLLILLAFGVVSAGVAWYIVKLSEDLPSMVEVANPKSSLPSILYDRNNQVIARLFIENRTPL